MTAIMLEPEHAVAVCTSPFLKYKLMLLLAASRWAPCQLPLQIFLLDMEGGSRAQASGQKWHEDLQWSRRLDEGWDLGAVKQVSQP